MGTWFDTYHLSRPPLVKDDYDPAAIGSSEVPPLRSRLADGLIFLGTLVGLLVALATANADEPATGVALGFGIALTAGAGGQLLCFAPEVRTAWAQRTRGWVAAFALVTLVGIGLLAWGLSG